jgi:deoxyribodipyrimidine photo-lyase
MNLLLKSYNRIVHIFSAEALEVFEYLTENFDIGHVFSYQESGIMKTWERDKNISGFLIEKNIQWLEFQQNGVQRGIKNRTHWDKNWYGHVHNIAVQNSYCLSEENKLYHPFSLSESFENQLKANSELFQKGGEKMAWKYLRSFCEERGKDYSRFISKPKESRKSCGRISPYLAWGNLSIRQAYQFVKMHPNYGKYSRGFKGLLTRLKWHCHFIQKFENECEYETLCVNRAYEELPYTNNEKHINQWQEGLTGFPMVDACMRCVKTTGWLNFRMRAMLVSVLCHHFDCHWRTGVYHLARQFLDYEPGIHYTQFQMQAGTTGVNTVRMYNPVKQSQDHDPEGVFIKEWVPELRDVPKEFIHEPWKMSTLDKELLAIKVDYPHPIVDLAASGKEARTKLWGYRKTKEVKSENQRIIKLHTRNNAFKKK